MGGAIEDLEFFATVAQNPTLTSAARSLGKSLPVVSKRLAALEKRLGATLVQRSTRRLVLTPEGQLYATRASAILGSVADLEDAVSADAVELRGNLAVESTIGLGRMHLTGLVAQFAVAHPQLSIQLSTSALPLSPDRRDFDVAVHVGRPADSELTIRRLLPNRRVLCAAPAYVEKHGYPESVESLASHNCIVLRENEGDYALWRFGTDGSERRVRVSGTLASNDGEIVTSWGLGGFGIIMRSQWHVGPYLAHGELVELLPHVPTPPADIFVVFDDTHYRPRRITSFVDFLARELPRRVTP